VRHDLNRPGGVLDDVRAKQAGGRAATGRTRPRVRPGHGAGKGIPTCHRLRARERRSRLAAAVWAGWAALRLGRLLGCHADCWAAACWLAAGLLRARNSAGLKGGRD
jgi:hypothetical protein